MSNSVQYPKEKMFLLLEGDAPEDYRKYFMIFAVAFIMTIVTIVFFVRAAIQFRGLSRRLTSMRGRYQTRDA